jgi:hypothetical protein
MKKLYLILFLWFPVVLAVKAQVPLTAINTAYNQNFNSLAVNGATNDVSTLPAGWLFLETGTNANTTYAAGTGSSNTGNTYSFGRLDSADRALGGLLSGSLTPTIGASFSNQTGTTITSLQITYRGEQWRLGASARGSDRLDFQYSLNATALGIGTWIDIDALDFNSPVSVGTVGALNGNDAVNSATLTFTLTGIAIPNGAIFFIRWSDFNVTSADDGLGIDNFSIVPSGLPPNAPSINFTPSALAFGDVNVGTSSMLTYRAKGANLATPITVTSPLAAYTLSLDASSFSSTITLPDSGGLVYVRFTPAANGAANTTIAHNSDTYSKNLTVTGNGFEQSANIISIASARTKSAGTKVTVAGRITVANEQGNPAYIQDATGGIPVFDFALATHVAIGDSVWVTGPIGLFNDQKQISGAGIFYTKIAAAPRVIAPKLINITDLAANEGLLVTVQNIQLVDKRFVFYPQSTESMTDGTHQADLRIDGDTDIPGLVKPQGVINITGVVGRFKTNAQLLPRFQADVPGTTEPTAPSDSIARSKTFDVVTWNFEFFGAEKEKYGNQEFGPADESLQLQHIKQVLDSLQADIVGVEEISNDSLFALLVPQLGKYAFTCSNRFSYSFNGPDNTFPPQKVCFIYDTTTVKILSARPLFEQLYDAARTTNPSLLPGYPGGASSFYSSGRLPYLVNTEVTINGVTEQISLIDIHAKSGATEPDRVRRAYDAQVLKDSLDAHFSTNKLIILGDLNDDLDVSIVPGAPSPYLPFVNDASNYSPITKALSDAGARSTTGFSDMIDHQIITRELIEEYLPGSVQVITPFRFIPNYEATTSDHLPVLSRYKFIAPVAQFVQSNITLSEDSTAYVVKVSLSKPLTSPKQLTIAVGGTATYGSDYTSSPASASNTITLALQAGDSVASFTVNVINDTADELAETATFTLQAVSGIEIGSRNTFTLTIEDNDIPKVSFLKLYASADEGAGPYTIKLKLSTPVASQQTVTLNTYALQNVVYGTDYITAPAASGNVVTVVIPAGSAEGQFTITPLADSKHEPLPEIVTFYLAATSNGLVAGLPRLFLFTIIDVKKKHPHFVIFPNPTHGLVKLLGEDVEDTDVMHAVLRNPSGELLVNANGTISTLSDEVSHRIQHGKKGIYTLNIEFDGETFLIRILNL